MGKIPRREIGSKNWSHQIADKTDVFLFWRKLICDPKFINNNIQSVVNAQ